jgi:carbonic anhydrase
MREPMNSATTAEWTRREFVTSFVAIVAAGGLVGASDVARAQMKTNGDMALQELMAGNERFVAEKMTSFEHDLKVLKEKTVSTQEPFAAVLSCADSRVPVELIFDQSIGHLFVARVAGNIITPEIVGSLEYAVAVLGVKAILVLGHSNCGAVSAAVGGKEVPGQISVLYQHLMQGVIEAHGDAALAVKTNAAYQAQLLRKSSTVIAKAMKDQGAKVAAGSYDLATGRVTLLA